MLEQQTGKQGGAGQGTFLGVTEELQAADDFAGGVLDQGQTEAANLGPELRDVVEVLGVQVHLLEQAPSRFDGAQVAFHAVLAALCSQQSFLPPDAAEGLLAEGKLEVALHPRGAPGGQLAFERHCAPPLGRGGEQRGRERRAAEFPQTSVALSLVAAQPFANGLGGGGKGVGGGLDAVLLGEAGHLQAEVVRVVALTHEIVIWDGTHRGMAPEEVLVNPNSVPDPGVPRFAPKQSRAAVAALPPPGPASEERTSVAPLLPSSRRRAAAPGGYDLYSVSQAFYTGSLTSPVFIHSGSSRKSVLDCLGMAKKGKRTAGVER